MMLSRMRSPSRKVGIAPTSRHQVDRLGRIPHEHNLALTASVDEARHLATRPLEGERRFLAQPINAAMDIRIVAPVIIFQAIDDTARFLRRCCTVEERQRFPVHRLIEDRELTPQRHNIEQGQAGVDSHRRTFIYIFASIISAIR
jgi:hypothetical protein